jgi:hypothetical protein
MDFNFIMVDAADVWWLVVGAVKMTMVFGT